MNMTPDSARTALEAIVDPVTAHPLGELKMVKDVAVDGTTVRVNVELTSPASGARDAIEKAARAVLTAAGAEKVEIEFTSNVRTRQVSGEDPCPDVKNVILVMSGKG